MAISEQLTDMGFGKHSLGEEQEVGTAELVVVVLGLRLSVPWEITY